jgi:ectoine hydroxylase-related dioxygenase (phytanoyl-CoA dioxygenase family)
MGTLLFYRGTHLCDISREQLQCVDEQTAGRAIGAWLAEKNLQPEGFELRRGDVTVHDKWTAHCAGANTSSAARPALAVHVMDARSKRLGARGPMQQGHVDLFRWHDIPVATELFVSVCPMM